MIKILLFLVLTGCASTPVTTGVPQWVGTVSAVLNTTRAAASGALQWVRSQEGIGAEREHAIMVLGTVEATSQVALSALAVYATDRTASAACRLHDDLQGVLTALAQVLPALDALHVTVPPLIPVALGALSATVDSIAQCRPAGAPPEISQIERRISP